MKVLVTGGSGFIGTNLMEYYLSKNIEVINLDIAPPKNSSHKCYWKKVSILDAVSLRTEVVNFSPSHIISLAAQTGIIDRARKLEDYATNFHGLKNLLEVTNNIPSLERLISTSSMAVCKIGYQPKSEIDYCPDTLYGESKVLGETVLRQMGTLPYSWVIVRPTGIWGPWFNTAYYALFNMIRKGFYVHPANANISQALGYVGNTVDQLDRLLKAPRDKVNTKTFYLADYPPVNFEEWTNLVQKNMKVRKIKSLPIWPLRTIAMLGDIAKLLGWEYPPLSSSRLNNMLTSFTIDLDPIVSENLPYTLEQAVEITVNWMCKNRI